VIRVRVKILGALAKPLGKEFELALEERSCLEDLLLAAGYQRDHVRLFHLAVNGVPEKLGRTLADGDQVEVVMLTSGG